MVTGVDASMGRPAPATPARIGGTPREWLKRAGAAGASAMRAEPAPMETGRAGTEWAGTGRCAAEQGGIACGGAARIPSWPQSTGRTMQTGRVTRGTMPTGRMPAGLTRKAAAPTLTVRIRGVAAR